MTIQKYLLILILLLNFSKIYGQESTFNKIRIQGVKMAFNFEIKDYNIPVDFDESVKFYVQEKIKSQYRKVFYWKPSLLETKTGNNIIEGLGKKSPPSDFDVILLPEFSLNISTGRAALKLLLFPTKDGVQIFHGDAVIESGITESKLSNENIRKRLIIDAIENLFDKQNVIELLMQFHGISEQMVIEIADIENVNFILQSLKNVHSQGFNVTALHANVNFIFSGNSRGEFMRSNYGLDKNGIATFKKSKLLHDFLGEIVTINKLDNQSVLLIITESYSYNSKQKELSQFHHAYDLVTEELTIGKKSVLPEKEILPASPSTNLPNFTILNKKRMGIDNDSVHFEYKDYWFIGNGVGIIGIFKKEQLSASQ